MKKYFPSALTIVAAIAIIIVLEVEMYYESKSIEIANSEQKGSTMQTWQYDPGWPRGVSVLLAGIIIGTQVHTVCKSKKKII